MTVGARPWTGAGGLFTSPPPSAGVEITSRRVTGVAVAVGRERARVSAYASEPLPSGAVAPTLNAANVTDPAALRGALASVLERIGRPRRVALVLPDSAAKVALVRFSTVPARSSELEQLLRWQVRKSVPFAVEEAQVAWTDGAPLADGGREFVVTVMRRDLVEGYEAACTAAGAHAGLVDVASFNVVNLVLRADASTDAPAAGDWLLVHLADDSSTLAIVREGRLVFYRNRANDQDGQLTDLVHQTAMYYEDRLGGGGFDRVVVAAAGAAEPGSPEALNRMLAERLRCRVESADPARVVDFADRISAGPALLAALAAPVGVVLRES